MKKMHQIALAVLAGAGTLLSAALLAGLLTAHPRHGKHFKKKRGGKNG